MHKHLCTCVYVCVLLVLPRLTLPVAARTIIQLHITCVERVFFQAVQLFLDTPPPTSLKCCLGYLASGTESKQKLAASHTGKVAEYIMSLDRRCFTLKAG